MQKGETIIFGVNLYFVPHTQFFVYTVVFPKGLYLLELRRSEDKLGLFQAQSQSERFYRHVVVTFRFGSLPSTGFLFRETFFNSKLIIR